MYANGPTDQQTQLVKESRAYKNMSEGHNFANPIMMINQGNWFIVVQTSSKI